MTIAESHAAVTSLEVEYLADFHITLRPVQIAATPVGNRMVAVIESGTVDGPRLRGEVLPGGGDSMLAGTDRIGRLDVRATIRTDDGELVFLTVTGRFQLPEEALTRLYAGETIAEHEMYGRTAPLFDTGSAKYAWLNSTVSVAFNELSLRHVRYRVYRVK